MDRPTVETFINILKGSFQVLKFFYLWLEGIVMACIPFSWHQKDVTGKIVLITGAGSGLGRLMSKHFALLGCQLVLWDINTAGLEETERLIKPTGAIVSIFTVDLSNRHAVYETADKVKQHIGDVDILVNNAGILIGKLFLESSDEGIVKTMEVNAMALFWTTKAFLPAMMERNDGHLVNIVSSAGIFALAHLADYCSSKFAALGFHESLANEIRLAGKDKVQTTVVCPYFINTGLLAGATASPLIPMLDQHDVADRIVKSVLANSRVVLIPRLMTSLNVLSRILPTKCGNVLSDIFGAHTAMETFVGRSKQA